MNQVAQKDILLSMWQIRHRKSNSGYILLISFDSVAFSILDLQHEDEEEGAKLPGHRVLPIQHKPKRSVLSYEVL